LLNEMAEGFLVPVTGKLLGIEVARFLLDDVDRKIDHFLVELALGDLLEILRVSPNLVCRAQGYHH